MRQRGLASESMGSREPAPQSQTQNPTSIAHLAVVDQDSPGNANFEVREEEHGNSRLSSSQSSG